VSGVQAWAKDGREECKRDGQNEQTMQGSEIEGSHERGAARGGVTG